MTTMHTTGLTDCDLVGRMTLPLSGWTARLHRGGGHLFRLVVDPGGGSPITCTLLPQAALGQLVLGAHRARSARPAVPPAGGTVTLAYGVVPAKPMRLTFLRYRVWRPAHARQVRPVVLADRVWLAEQAGRFDEVQATVSGHTVTRLL
ncbi:hypothetical protein [Thermomonospora amylolytica]|uniref:hypothetical protein n=1 Tax=Thermomonospora amylolytica TaxID=1411117 RepID=UPI000E6BD0D5|nr:hypothetical protein [Thermomonospora amylolytica]